MPIPSVLTPLFLSSLLSLQSTNSTFSAQLGNQYLASLEISLYTPVIQTQYTILLPPYNSSLSQTYSKTRQLNQSDPEIIGTLGEEIITISTKTIKIPVITDLTSKPSSLTSSLLSLSTSLLSKFTPQVLSIHLLNSSEYLLTFQGKPEFFPEPSVEIQAESWEMNITGVIFGSFVGFNSTSAKFSLKNKYILAPKSQTTQIFDYFLKKFNCGLTVSLSSIFCACDASLPDIYLKVNETQLAIPQSSYQDKDCELKFSSSEENIWELGEPFFKSYSLMYSSEDSKLFIFSSSEFSSTTTESPEDSTDDIIVIIEIIAGCIVIFILARLGYSYCMTIEFRPSDESQPLLNPRTATPSLVSQSPRKYLSPRR